MGQVSRLKKLTEALEPGKTYLLSVRQLTKKDERMPRTGPTHVVLRDKVLEFKGR
jgi:hypothetical protein